MEALVKKLKTIPHLKLGIKTDPLKMRMQAARIPVLKKYEFKNPTVFEHYNKVWSGAGIKSYDGDPYSEFVDVKVVQNAMPPPAIATKYAETCPYLFELAEQFEGMRARVLRIAANSELLYHSHVQEQDYLQRDDVMIVQMPFVVPKDCVYSVIETGDFNMNGPAGKRYDQRYEAGEAWLFNGYHHHNVFNPGDQPRLTFMFYAKLSNPKFRALVEEALETYYGPYVV